MKRAGGLGSIARGVFLGLSFGLLAEGGVVAAGHRDESLEPGWSPLVPALQETLRSGTPCVVVVSSRGEAVCESLRRQLAQELAGRAAGRIALLAEMPVETNSARVRDLGVTRFPTVLVYGRKRDRLELLAYREAAASAKEVAVWVDDLPLSSRDTSDDEVQTVQYQPVAPAASAQAAVPPALAVPAAAPSFQPARVVAAPAPAPLVVAPPAQTIVVAPAPPPNVVFAAAPVAAPQAYYSLPSPAAQPYYMAAPSPQGQAQVVMLSPQAGYYAPAAGSPPAVVAESPLGMAVATMILTNPTVMEKILGAIGRHFADKGQPRLAMAPVPAAPAAAVYLVPVAAQAPVSYAPAQWTSVPAAAPTPQHGGLFRHLRGRE